MDTFARGRRSLTGHWKKILRGREYNAEKKAVGKPKGSKKIFPQAEEISSESTVSQIAAKSGCSKATVERDAQRAKVYDAVEAEFGRDRLQPPRLSNRLSHRRIHGRRVGRLIGYQKFGA